MSIQRIDIPRSHTHGWQARVPIPGTRRRLTRFVSDSQAGGPGSAYRLAKIEERKLWAAQHTRRD